MNSNKTGNFTKLLNKTYRFLSYRPRSVKEVEEYLNKNVSKVSKGGLVNSIIQKLKEQKFLDDKEFTKWWIESRTKYKPKALRIIKFELKQKGIGRELIEEVLSDKSLELETEFEKALKLAQAKVDRYKNVNRKKKYEKMARFLASKGFDWDMIKEVLVSLKLKAKRD